MAARGCRSFVRPSRLLGDLPVVYNVANLPKPAPGEPALISFDDVTTMFHEFGHALHGMFANTRYPTLSGTTPARDFVEFPSQFNEHWAIYPAVFDHYARHYQTGARMPRRPGGKIKKAKNFNEGYALTEVLAAAELDMQWHVLPADAPLQDPDEFERQGARQDAPRHPCRCRLDIDRATSAISGTADIRPATMPTCGRRCSMTTRTNGSTITVD